MDELTAFDPIDARMNQLNVAATYEGVDGADVIPPGMIRERNRQIQQYRVHQEMLAEPGQGVIGRAWGASAPPTAQNQPRCWEAVHHFACRHESVCECGACSRTPPALFHVEQGL